MAAEVGTSQHGSADADFEFQAVRSMPRETLEEQYVKVVNYNEILKEDRGSFMRFCSELIPESDGLFEEAAAQESPVNLSVLLKKSQDASERREQRTREVAAAREQELLDEVEVHKAEARRACKEIELMRADAERHNPEVRRLMQQKGSALEQLQTRMSELQEEFSSNAFITQCAEAPAGRDAELPAQNRQAAQLNTSMLEMQKLLDLSYAQDKALKDRIRELEQSHGRSHAAGDYLKHVVLRYVQYSQAGDSKSRSLVPVICTLLNFSSEERQSVEQPALTEKWWALAQAVSGASLWRKGHVGTSGTTAPVVDDSSEAG
eukprot:CAMPEP_0172807654 /NCGR_PEP_ID=MMETSP1075-20121228/7154_1 /TAXON_ID=2916 /ORGANISM="Ceratium fusus, Strain PA161109" /LENGTH=319 /DNA_ID=CAMNT_0013646677 /DNA_START=59 /DNA_END=1018 /DNA_ORIENTATION=-